jgi:hypothetical protein
VSVRSSVDVLTTGGAGLTYGDGSDEDRVLLMARGAVSAWQEASSPTRVLVEPDAGNLTSTITVYGLWRRRSCDRRSWSSWRALVSRDPFA